MKEYIKSVKFILDKKTDAEKIDWLLKNIERIRKSTKNKIICIRKNYEIKSSKEFKQKEIEKLKEEVLKLKIENKVYKKIIDDFRLKI